MLYVRRNKVTITLSSRKKEKLTCKKSILNYIKNIYKRLLI